MQIETKLEIRSAAMRIIPGLIGFCQLLAVLAMVTALLNLGAILVVMGSDPEGVAAVTESGQVHIIPLKNK